jgi:hypothetical protein
MNNFAIAIMVLLAAIAAAGAYWFAIRRRTSGGLRMSHEEVAATIEQFLDGTCGPHDWDDFTSVEIRDPYLDSVRAKCDSVANQYPATKPGHYCNEEGLAALRRLASEVRNAGRRHSSV